MGAFLDREPGRHSDLCGERINVASGVPHDSNGVGIVRGSEQGSAPAKSGSRVQATIS